jgi:hypothetical protein
MAATRLIKRHISYGFTAAQSMKDSFDYGQSPDKTQGGELIAAYMCDGMITVINATSDKVQITWKV